MSDRAEHGDLQSRKSLELLRISIKARIEDFDSFFKRNFTDYRIPLFEKQKYRLRKLIHESQNANRVPRELDIRFSIDDAFNSTKHYTMRQERSKSHIKISSVKIVIKALPSKLERSKSPVKTPNTLVKVKMTKEEYEEYIRQVEEKQRNKEVVTTPKLYSQPEPITSKIKPPTSSVHKSPIRIKRV